MSLARGQSSRRSRRTTSRRNLRTASGVSPKLARCAAARDWIRSSSSPTVMASVTPTRATIRLRRAVSRATSACESVGDPKDSPRDASTNAAARDEERRARETTVAVAWRP